MYFEQFWWENDLKMFSFRFSLKERFYFSRTDFWLFSLTVRRLSAKQHKQVRLLQEPQLKIDKKNLKTFGSLKCFLYLCNVEDKKIRDILWRIPEENEVEILWCRQMGSMVSRVSLMWLRKCKSSSFNNKETHSNINMMKIKD